MNLEEKIGKDLTRAEAARMLAPYLQFTYVEPLKLKDKIMFGSVISCLAIGYRCCQLYAGLVSGYLFFKDRKGKECEELKQLRHAWKEDEKKAKQELLEREVLIKEERERFDAGLPSEVITTLEEKSAYKMLEYSGEDFDLRILESVLPEYKADSSKCDVLKRDSDGEPTEIKVAKSLFTLYLNGDICFVNGVHYVNEFMSESDVCPNKVLEWNSKEKAIEKLMEEIDLRTQQGHEITLLDKLKVRTDKENIYLSMLGSYED